MTLGDQVFSKQSLSLCLVLLGKEAISGRSEVPCSPGPCVQSMIYLPQSQWKIVSMNGRIILSKLDWLILTGI